ncbi:Glyoxal oxidase-related protein [Theobroma cacao]|uniref:Glyoxal oxidase-related protein n=1 Tax=Theobroma cacao TaxID=3641 RepID=A0A061G3V9_THECC|nr:Glyoxal oxidase-related protein [Theobroma cacao]
MLSNSTIFAMSKAAMEPKILVFLLLVSYSSVLFNLALGAQTYQGKWKLLKRSIGISAMHMALLPNERIVTFDRTDFGPSNITLPQGKCMKDLQSSDCFAHSVEFDPATRAVRPLTILSDTWCSSGALSQDGTLVQSGGYRLGEKVVRYFKPCMDCDWEEDQNGLLSPRWYASNQILPDGKIIVVGGRYQFTYEFIPKASSSDQRLYQLPFLKETRYSPLVSNNLYPFLHLSTDGNLFVFANDRGILLDYVNNKVIRTYPVMPGGFSHNYPSTGSSVLLPLKLLSTDNENNTSTPDAEVLICGGTPPDSNEKANIGIFVPASRYCGRLIITAASPEWEMEEMPINRVMGDMIMLPTGDVLIINGAAKGSAGWGVARKPVLNPVLYRPADNPSSDKNTRFEVLSPSMIPRLYHSTAQLLSDGRVLVGGSNPNMNYNFSALYPTELSLEAFYPPYLSSTKPRPSILAVRPGLKLGYKQKVSLEFTLEGNVNQGDVYVTMVAPSFTTHSIAMNQRLLVLALDEGVKKTPSGNYLVKGYAPETAALAPPGYYQLFLVHEGIPSKGTWVHIKQSS